MAAFEDKTVSQNIKCAKKAVIIQHFVRQYHKLCLSLHMQMTKNNTDDEERLSKQN